MKPNSPEAIATAWNRLCETYAEDLTNTAKRKTLAMSELAVIRKELGTQRGLRILDAGCGSGWHGAQLAGDGHHVVMTDISSEMARKARAAADSACVRDHIGIIQEDIRNSSLRPASFDAIVSCGTVISDCGDTDAALSEFSRLLRDNGVALFSTRNLLVSLDKLFANGTFNDMSSSIEQGRLLVPRGHQAFDWVYFTVEGLKDACQKALMKLQRVYPIGMAPPPKDGDDIPSYVQLHMDMVDNSEALAGAHELLAVAQKVDDSVGLGDVVANRAF